MITTTSKLLNSSSVPNQTTSSPQHFPCLPLLLINPAHLAHKKTKKNIANNAVYNLNPNQITILLPDVTINAKSTQFLSSVF